MRAHLQLIVVALLWGATWPAGRVVASNIPPVTGAAWRFVLAAVLMLLWMGVRRGEKRGYPRYSVKQWLWIAAGGISGVTLYALCFMYGLRLVPAGRGSLFITLTPVAITLAAAWLFHESFNWKMFASMMLAVVGACIVITKGDIMSALTHGLQWGEYVLLGCVLTWTVYSLVGKVTGTWGDNFAVTTYSIVIGAVFLCAVAWWLDGVVPDLPMESRVQHVHSAATVWYDLLFLAVGGTMLAYAGFFDGVSKVGAGVTASYVTLVPVFGVFFSWLTLGEQISWSLLVGGVCAVLGVWLMQRFKSS